jgi:hypothetical protein
VTSAEVLRTVLDYDPENGSLTWRERDPSTFPATTPLRIVRNWNSRFAGKPAFTALGANGYRVGSFGGKALYAHRVVWAWVHGIWPVDEIDHLDGDRSNNAVKNLRAATPTMNRRNQGRSTRNTSGYTGVTYCQKTGTWVAQMTVRGVCLRFGKFRCPTAAAIARKKADPQFGFHKNHGRA